MISGFEIRTEIGSAEPYRLFRALRERDGSAVLLKTCDLDGDIERTALAREFEILRACTTRVASRCWTFSPRESFRSLSP